MVNKFVEKKTKKQLKQDLEKYRQRAIEMGATDAKIIKASQKEIRKFRGGYYLLSHFLNFISPPKFLVR